MATDTVANATKMVRMATRSFQAVAKLATSSKLTTKGVSDFTTETCELATKFLVVSRRKRLDFIFNFEPCTAGLFELCYAVGHQLKGVGKAIMRTPGAGCIKAVRPRLTLTSNVRSGVHSDASRTSLGVTGVRRSLGL